MPDTSTPEWVKATLAAVAGMVATMVTLPFTIAVTQRVERERMRTMLYLEIAHNLGILAVLRNEAADNGPVGLRSITFDTSAFDYAIDHPDRFLMLPEAHGVKMVYSILKELTPTAEQTHQKLTEGLTLVAWEFAYGEWKISKMAKALPRACQSEVVNEIADLRRPMTQRILAKWWEQWWLKHLLSRSNT